VAPLVLAGWLRSWDMPAVVMGSTGVRAAALAPLPVNPATAGQHSRNSAARGEGLLHDCGLTAA
jgi:hypothetical protein